MNLFTKFYESYWLPERFGFDTRRVQFSSPILTGQMTREDALSQLNTPPHDPVTIGQDKEYVAAKLRITQNELENYFSGSKSFSGIIKIRLKCSIWSFLLKFIERRRLLSGDFNNRLRLGNIQAFANIYKRLGIPCQIVKSIDDLNIATV